MAVARPESTASDKAGTVANASQQRRRRPRLTYQEANQLYGYVSPQELYRGALTRRALARALRQRLRDGQG
jgi:hypothetical protein